MITYIKDAFAELKNHVTWTPQSELLRHTTVVVVFSIIFSLAIWGARRLLCPADTGAFDSGIELNAVQRSNPEMQKRVANTVRAAVEADNNPIISIHDHGAGGHLNCLSRQ